MFSHYNQIIPVQAQFHVTFTQLRRFIDTDKDTNNKKKKKSTKQPKKQDQSLYYNVLTPNCKVQCDICEKDITKYVKITSGEKDYCVGCFSNLEEHPEQYTVINKLNFPIFDNEWAAEQELLMTEALERHGFGNWNEISEQIGTDKTASDVEKHYQDIFMKADNFIPKNREILSQRDSKSLKLTVPKSARTEIRKGRRPKDEHPSFNLGNSAQRGSLTSGTPTANQTLLNTGCAGEIVGFMPKRGDFEVEYDNEAELLLAEMEFNEDDTEEETEMKYKILEIYNYRLSERIKRKEFVISRQLLDVKLQAQLEKNRGKEERETYNAMKVYARFNPPDEHEKLIEGIIKEKQIRQRIEQLRHYKKMGMKTLADVEEHLEQKKRKDQKNKRSNKPVENYVLDKSVGKTSASRRTRGNLTEGTVVEKTITGLPADETALCEEIGLTTGQYLAVKETLIRESLKNGFITKDGVEDVFRIERQKVNGVFDFLVKGGIVLQK